MQEIANDKFSLAQLDGKLLNYRADITNQEIQSIGRINEVISGDSVTAQRKFGQPFEFKPYCKLIFSANQPPEINDDSDAVYRRYVIIEWLQQFIQDPTDEDLENGIRKSDPELIIKLTTEDELSGILNLLIAQTFISTIPKTRAMIFILMTSSQWS